MRRLVPQRLPLQHLGLCWVASNLDHVFLCYHPLGLWEPPSPLVSPVLSDSLGQNLQTCLCSLALQCTSLSNVLRETLSQGKDMDNMILIDHLCRPRPLLHTSITHPLGRVSDNTEVISTYIFLGIHSFSFLFSPLVSLFFYQRDFCCASLTYLVAAQTVKMKQNHFPSRKQANAIPRLLCC